MKYLKSHKLFEKVNPGYEFVKDVFQDLSDEGYRVDINVYEGFKVGVYIEKPEYRADGETIKRFSYFHPDSVINTLNFAIDYLSSNYHMNLVGGAINNSVEFWDKLEFPTFKNKSGKQIPELVHQIKLVFSPPLRKIESYKLFEGSSHWREDILPKLNWNRIDEIYDMMLEFQDLGWILPKKETDYSNFHSFGGGIKVEIVDEVFNEPGKKIELLERKHYKSYIIWMTNNPGRTANYDRELFKEIVDLLSKLEGFGYQYKVDEVSKNSIKIETYNKEDVFDPSIVIKDMKKAKVKVSIGIDNALDRLHNQQKIMNIEKVDDKRLFVTQKVEKYDLEKIYNILNKTLNGVEGNRFNVIRDYSNDRIVISTRGKWI